MSRPYYEYYRGPLYNLTRAMLGDADAEHGFRVAERLLNAGARWGVAALGQVYALPERTGLSVADVHELAVCCSLDYMEQEQIGKTCLEALEAVSRRTGEGYQAWAERVTGSSPLAVAIALAVLREHARPGVTGVRRALEILEAVEPSREALEDMQ